jgi:hypothetical protein
MLIVMPVKFSAEALGAGEAVAGAGDAVAGAGDAVALGAAALGGADGVALGAAAVAATVGAGVAGGAVGTGVGAAVTIGLGVAVAPHAARKAALAGSMIPARRIWRRDRRRFTRSAGVRG